MEQLTVEKAIPLIVGVGIVLLGMILQPYVGDLWAWWRRRGRARPVWRDAEGVMSEQQDGAAAVVPFGEWWPMLWGGLVHLFVVGPTNSGKTTTMKALLRHIVLERGQRVIVLDPKANLDTWGGLPAVTDLQQIEWRLYELLEELRKRLRQNARLTEAEAAQAFEEVWIVADEIGLMRRRCPSWPLFFTEIGSVARALKMHLVILNQSRRVKELGIAGSGDLRDNFVTLVLPRQIARGRPGRLEWDEDQPPMLVDMAPFPALARGEMLPMAALYSPSAGSSAAVPAAVPASDAELVPAAERAIIGAGTSTGGGNHATEPATWDAMVAHLATRRGADVGPDVDPETATIRRWVAAGLGLDDIRQRLGVRKATAAAKVRAAVAGTGLEEVWAGKRPGAKAPPVAVLEEEGDDG